MSKTTPKAPKEPKKITSAKYGTLTVDHETKKESALKSARSFIRGAAIIIAFMGGKNIVNEQEALQQVTVIETALDMLLPALLWLSAEVVGWWSWIRKQFKQEDNESQ